MMAKRFRSVGWVGCVAVAALSCYLVSQRVATERAAVERLDRRMLIARIDIRKLETELGTRSGMPVLEQWNSQVLALSAPSADQYLHGEVQLARFETRPAAPAAIQEVSVAAEDSVAARAPAKPILASASAPASDTAQPILRHANFVKPTDGSFDASPKRVALLDESLLSDLQQAAQREKRNAQ